MKILRIFALIFLLPCTCSASESAAPSIKKAAQPAALGPIALATKLPEELVALVAAYRGLIVNPEARTLYGGGISGPRNFFKESYLEVLPSGCVAVTAIYGNNWVDIPGGSMTIKTRLFDENGPVDYTCNHSSIEKEALTEKLKKQREVTTALKEQFGTQCIGGMSSAVLLHDDKLFVYPASGYTTVYSVCQRDVAPAASSGCAIM